MCVNFVCVCVSVSVLVCVLVDFPVSASVCECLSVCVCLCVSVCVSVCVMDFHDVETERWGVRDNVRCGCVFNEIMISLISCCDN